jgi:hypothetical protein
LCRVVPYANEGRTRTEIDFATLPAAGSARQPASPIFRRPRYQVV